MSVMDAIGSRTGRTPGAADDLFSLEGFRSRALRRLPLAAERDTGDHILNPDLGPYAKWTGDPREAAVLIPVLARPLLQGLEPGEASVLFTLRTPHLTAHGGQIAFPGGKIDPEDGSPEAAALREAQEEIGLDPSAVEPFARLSPYLTGSGYRITPVVGLVHELPRLTANPGEVADIFDVPLGFLMRPENHQRQSREWQGRPRYFYAMPYETRYIWGVTAGIVRSLYETVYA